MRAAEIFTLLSATATVLQLNDLVNEIMSCIFLLTLFRVQCFASTEMIFFDFVIDKGRLEFFVI
jgi:hypothetical protein